MDSPTDNNTATPEETCELAARFCECLGWTDVKIEGFPNNHGRKFITGKDKTGEIALFDFTFSQNVENLISEFVGKRFWLQINRDAGTYFAWRVRIGLQNVIGAGEQGRT